MATPSDPGKDAARWTPAKAKDTPAAPVKQAGEYCGLLGKVVTACPTEGTENCSTC